VAAGVKTNWRRYRADLLALAALALLSLGYFWRPLLSRGVWVPMGGGDMPALIFPMLAFAAHSLHAGVLPLWNPSVHAGLPFAGDLQVGLFYPPNWWALVRGDAFNYRDLELILLVHYPLAGGLMYLLARDLGHSRAAAWVSGTVFMLSGFMVTHLGHVNMVQSATWLPLEFLLARRALLRGSWRYAVAAGAALAVAFLAGHIHMVMFQVLVLSAFVLAAPLSWRARLSLWRRASTLAITGLVAFGATALKALPGAQQAGYSVRSELPWNLATDFSAWPIGLATLFLPHLWGSNPTNYWGPWSNTEVLGYVGILPLLLAALALVLRRSFHSVFFVALAVVALLLCVGDATPLYGWVFRFVPGFSLVRTPGRYLYVFDFAIAVAAGIGLDGLRVLATTRRGALPDEERILGWLARFLACGIAVVLGLALPALVILQADNANLVPRIITATQDFFFLALFLGAALVLLGGVLLRWLSPNAATALAVAIVAVDLASAYHDFNPTTDDPAVGFKHPELIARLQQAPGVFRIDSETGAISLWQPDSASVIGLQDAGGLYNPTQPLAFPEFRKDVGLDYTAATYDLMNIRYLIAPDDPAFVQRLKGAPSDSFQLLGTYPGGLALWENRGALARARVVYRAESVPDFDAAIARLRQPSFDSHTVALVQDAPALGDAGAPPPTDAEILTYAPNTVEIQADAAAPGYLILADAAFPGWYARVDGAPVTISTAYGAFRAVPLAPGHHVVRFQFDPPAWEIGWRLSALTWAALGVLAGWTLVGTLLAGTRQPSVAIRPDRVIEPRPALHALRSEQRPGDVGPP
jgi:hypothetical protein